MLTHADESLAKRSAAFSRHLHANQPDNSGRITQAQADEILRSSPYFDRLDDVGPVDDRGFLYFLEDGSMVLIDLSGPLAHSPNCNRAPTSPSSNTSTNNSRSPKRR